MKNFITKTLGGALLALLTSHPLHAATDIPDEGTLAYRNGDYTRAFQIWNKGAQQGDYRAQFLLSSLYAEGQGVPKDPETSMKWLNAAAAGGFDAAQFNLGNNYYNGIGVEQDYQKAVAWWSRSARQGFTQAQYNLGVAYLTGKGVERNDKEAVRWFGQAAIAGSEVAREILDKMGIDIYGPRAGASNPQPAPGQQAAPGQAPAANPPPAAENWLSAQPNASYTIQLLSTPDREKALNFGSTLGNQHPTAIIPFHHKGATWYKVVLGHYPDHASAKQAMQQLPLKAWKTDGWPQRIGDLRNIMIAE